MKELEETNDRLDAFYQKHRMIKTADAFSQTDTIENGVINAAYLEEEFCEC